MSCSSSSLEDQLVPNPKAKTKVWENFGCAADENGTVLDKKKVVCRLCRRSIGYSGNTTNLTYHIRAHPTIYKQQVEQKEVAAEPGAKCLSSLLKLVHTLRSHSIAALILLWRLTVRRIATQPRHHYLSLSCRPLLSHSYAGISSSYARSCLSGDSLSDDYKGSFSLGFSGHDDSLSVYTHPYPPLALCLCTSNPRTH
uniref:BED-type domain-containing protein n=1 Tax=Amphimedon queenslandica TaxID=400682 RepID=A0A1X7T3T3_AMPQE